MSSADHRNVILILTDQQRFDTLGCHGVPFAATPNLDRLAANGLSFQNHIVANPVCSPSRGCLMTGRHTTDHGLWANGCELPHDVTTLPQAFNAHGFQTAHFGKLHLEPILRRTGQPHHYGFETCEIAEGDQMLTNDAYFNWLRSHHPDQFCQYLNEMFVNGHDSGYTSKLPEELHLSHWVTDRGVDWLKNRRKDEAPFLLSIGYFDPHHAFNPVEPYASAFADADIPEPLYDEAGLATKPQHYQNAAHGMAKITRDPEKSLRIRQTYHAMCAHLDACIGRLLDTVEQLGLGDDTVVIFSSDHGEMLCEHGMLWKGPYMLDDLLRVPMIVSRAGKPIDTPGQTPAGVTSAIDLMSTAQAVAGIEPDQQTRGTGRPFVDADLRPFPEGVSRFALTEWEHPADKPTSSLRCIRTATHKLVHYNRSDEGELYDLTADPREVTNLYDEPAAAEARSELEALLQEHYDGDLAARPAVPHLGGW